MPFNQICLLLCILLTYFWACHLFDKQVAITAGLLLLFSDTLWSYGVSGLLTNFLMLLWLTTLFCLFHADRALNPVVPADGTEPTTPVNTGLAITLTLVAAVLLGLCFLTRYTMALMVIPLALYVGRIWNGRKGLLWASLYLAVFLAVIAPWLVHNLKVSGSFLGIAQYQWRGGESLQRTLKVTTDSLLPWTSMTSGTLHGLRETIFSGLKSMGSDFFVFFFGVGLLYGFRSQRNNRLRIVTVAGVVFAILGMALFGAGAERVEPQINGNNLLVLFLPLVAIFGVAFFYLLLNRIAFPMQLMRGIVIGLFVFVNVLPFVLTFLPPKKADGQYPPYNAQLTQSIAKLFSTNEVGVSDHPWSMAWMGDRRTVMLPLTVDDYIFINDRITPHNTQFLLFTPHITDRPFESDLIAGEDRYWLPILLGNVPKLFPLTAQVRLIINRPQLLMADRDRWSNKSNLVPAPQSTNTTTKGTP